MTEKKKKERRKQREHPEWANGSGEGIRDENKQENYEYAYV